MGTDYNKVWAQQREFKAKLKQMEILSEKVGYSEVIDVEFTDINKPEKEIMKELPKE